MYKNMYKTGGGGERYHKLLLTHPLPKKQKNNDDEWERHWTERPQSKHRIRWRVPAKELLLAEMLVELQLLAGFQEWAALAERKNFSALITAVH